MGILQNWPIQNPCENSTISFKSIQNHTTTSPSLHLQWRRRSPKQVLNILFVNSMRIIIWQMISRLFCSKAGWSCSLLWQSGCDLGTFGIIGLCMPSGRSHPAMLKVIEPKFLLVIFIYYTINIYIYIYILWSVWSNSFVLPFFELESTWCFERNM